MKGIVGYSKDFRVEFRFYLFLDALGLHCFLWLS